VAPAFLSQRGIAVYMTPREHPTSAPVNVGKECKETLLTAGIDPVAMPSYNGILKFFSSVNDNMENVDKKSIACIKKEITLLNQRCDDPIVKRVLREERAEINKKFEKILDESKSDEKGTVLKMAMKPPGILKEFR
jgi:hypothetical protein